MQTDEVAMAQTAGQEQVENQSQEALTQSEQNEFDDNQEQTQQNDDNESESSENAETKKKRSGGYARKLRKLEGYVDHLETELERIKRREAPQSSTTTAGNDTSFSAEPHPDDFETNEEYIQKRIDWELKQREAKEAERREKENQRKVLQTHQQRVEEFASKVPDYQETLEDYDDMYPGQFTLAMQDAIVSSDFGPQIAYHIAKNPEEGAKMAQMSVMQLQRYVGRLEAKLESNSSSVKVEQKRKTTAAPPPLNPVSQAGAGGSSFDPYNASHLSQEEYSRKYREWRAKQKT